MYDEGLNSQGACCSQWLQLLVRQLAILHLQLQKAAAPMTCL